MASHGNFHWNELMTRHPDRAKAFYESAIGWTFDAMPMGDMTYWVAKMDDKPVGGMFEMKGPDFDKVPEQWMPYLAVDDIDARLEKAVAAGATVMRQTFEVPEVGRMAILRQPDGAVLGWITPAS